MSIVVHRASNRRRSRGYPIKGITAIPPLAEEQAAWAADLVEGTAALPPADELWETIRREDEERRRRFVDSKRHRMEVDFYSYLLDLERERKLGRRRSADFATAAVHA